MKNDDRFKDYDKEVRDLVLEFERTVVQGESQFFDADELAIIADFYLETRDLGKVAQAVAYGRNLYPDDIAIEVRRANLYICQERYKEALGLLTTLRQREPKDTDVIYSMGICYSMMKDHERAIAYFREASTDGWQVSRNYFNIAEEYCQMERYDEAAKNYRHSLELDCEDSLVVYNYFDLCYRLDRLDEVLDFYHTLVSQHPYCKELWHCIGCAYRHKYQFEQSIEAFEYALAIDTRFYAAYIDLSISYEEAGQVVDSATALNRALDCADNRSEVLVMLAALYGRNANVDMSLLYARKAVEADPMNPLAYATLALDYSEMGDHSAAIDYAQQALSLGDDVPDVLSSAAHVYNAAGRPDRAQYCFDRMLCYECSEQNFLCYALFLCNQKSWNDLMFFCQQMLEIFPDHPDFTTYLAASLFNTNRYNRARRLLPACDADMLLEICPTMQQHPLFMQIIQTSDHEK